MEGKPFLLDPASKLVYKEVRGAGGATPEQVGKWVQVSQGGGEREPGRDILVVLCLGLWFGLRSSLAVLSSFSQHLSEFCNRCHH